MEQIIRYLGIDDREKQLAEVVWQVVDGDMAEVFDNFYTRTREANTGLTLDDTTIARLKLRQKEHWRALFHSHFDAEFFRRASMIGLRHHAIGLSATWYIAGYSIIKLELGTLLMNSRSPLSLKTSLIATLEKYVALDMACSLSSYSAWLVD